MAVSRNFIQIFSGKKVLLNLNIHGAERFYTGTVLEIDGDSDSLLFIDKFGVRSIIDFSAITKIEEFIEGYNKNNMPDPPQENEEVD